MKKTSGGDGMKKKKLFAFIRSNWLSAIMLASATISALVGLFWPDDKLSLKALSIAVALIAGDLFLLIGQYLDSIKNALKDIKSDKAEGVQLSRWNNNLDGEMIKEAEECLFFSGYDISRLGLNREELLGLPENIKVRMLAMNMDDEKMRDLFEITFGREPGQKSLDHLKGYAKRPNIKIQTVDFPMSIYVTARDIHKATGKMQVGFLSYTKSGYNAHCLHLTPDDKDWYDYYKTQIELLWDQGTPWPPPAKEGTP